MDDILLAEVVEQMCEAFSEEAVELAVDTMYGMVANAGQDSLISTVAAGIESQVEAISYGDFEYVESAHPEAVFEIAEMGNEIATNASEVCRFLRNVESWSDLDMFHI